MDEKLFALSDRKNISAMSKILGNCVGNGIVKPDLERLWPLRELPAPENKRALQ